MLLFVWIFIHLNNISLILRHQNFGGRLHNHQKSPTLYRWNNNKTGLNTKSMTVIAKIKDYYSTIYQPTSQWKVIQTSSMGKMWRNPCIWNSKPCQLHVKNYLGYESRLPLKNRENRSVTHAIENVYFKNTNTCVSKLWKHLFTFHCLF